MTSEHEADAPDCGVCGEGVRPADGRACAGCSAPHHLDCWQFNQGCSVFGCGGLEHVPFAERAAALRGGQLTIREGTRPALRLAPLLQGLGRRMRSRLPFVAATLPASLLGVGVSIAIGTAFQADPFEKPWVVAAMVLAAVFYGLLAPFLASLQLRRPRTLTLGALLAGVGIFTILTSLRVRGFEGTIPFALCLTGCLTFSAGVSEIVAGYRTALGERLGRFGALARGAVACLALAFSVWILASVEKARLVYEAELFLIALTMGLMGAGIAVPAIEQGKKAFLEAVGAPALPPARGGRGAAPTTS